MLEYKICLMTMSSHILVSTGYLYKTVLMLSAAFSHQPLKLTGHDNNDLFCSVARQNQGIKQTRNRKTIPGIPKTKYIANEFLIITMNSLRDASDVPPCFRLINLPVLSNAELLITFVYTESVALCDIVIVLHLNEHSLADSTWWHQYRLSSLRTKCWLLLTVF